MDDTHWMQHALRLAERAAAEGEVPVGAVVVCADRLLGEGWNQPISTHDATAHAEIQALRSACQHENNYRLPQATMYVTLEPCLMCAGAMIHARIQRLVYATPEPKTGAAGSCIDAFSLPNLNHRTQTESGVCAEHSAELLRQFFRARRK